MEDRTDLSRINRPPKDEFVHFQPVNQLRILSTNGYQNCNLRGSPPMGNPKYKKGSWLCLQFITLAASWSQETTTPTPNNMLLWKLTFNPEIDSNNNRTALKALTFAQDLTPINKVSSANWRWETSIITYAPTA